MSALQFVDRQAADKLLCSLCMDVYSDPVQVCENEHHLCRACANGIRRPRKCPECRKKLCIKEGQRFLKASLEELRVRCPNAPRGCMTVCSREGLKAHQATCPHEMAECQHCPLKMDRQLLNLTHFHCDGARFGCDFLSDSDEKVSVHMCDCPVLKCRKQFEKYEHDIADLRQSLVPRGAALPWSGFVTDVPAGWALCDGQRGRPDFSNFFAVSRAAKRQRRNADAGHGVHYSFAYIVQQAMVDVYHVASDEDDDSDDDEDEEGEDEDEEDSDRDANTSTRFD